MAGYTVSTKEMFERARARNDNDTDVSITRVTATICERLEANTRAINRLAGYLGELPAAVPAASVTLRQRAELLAHDEESDADGG